MTDPKGRRMQNPETHRTKALVERLFAAYKRGDSRALFDHVADDVHWTITAKNPLSGEYHSKQEFLEATYERLAAVLEDPVRAFYDAIGLLLHPSAQPV
jgi:ketosteroid isomerase-like protein